MVVSLWTSDLTASYPPRLNAFGSTIKSLGETSAGISLDDEVRAMDAPGIEKGRMTATTGDRRTPETLQGIEVPELFKWVMTQGNNHPDFLHGHGPDWVHSHPHHGTPRIR